MSAFRSLAVMVALPLLVLCLPAFAQPPASPPQEPRGQGEAKRRELEKQYDRDGDGQLSPEERRALVRDIVEGKIEVPPQLRENLRRKLGAAGKLETQAPQARPAEATGRQLPANVTIERDLAYGHAGDRALKLDLILPKEPADGPLPLVVFIHGGGWRNGDKSGGVGRVAPFVATGNYAGASIGYRLSGEATWPAQIHDCKAAIRWLRANAEKYRIDPDRIGVWGSSAGGHLVSMLGVSGDVKELEGECGTPDASSRVACVVDYCGPANFLAGQKFEGGRSPSAVDLLLGGAVETKQDLARQASPITHVTADDPPFLVVHGTADGTVPFEQAEMFHAALEKAGVDATFVRILEGGHGIGGDAVQQRVTAFFEKHLRGKDVAVSGEAIPNPSPRR